MKKSLRNTLMRRVGIVLGGLYLLDRAMEMMGRRRRMRWADKYVRSMVPFPWSLVIKPKVISPQAAKAAARAKAPVPVAVPVPVQTTSPFARLLMATVAVIAGLTLADVAVLTRRRTQAA